jgi:hypothetical protein
MIHYVQMSESVKKSIWFVFDAEFGDLLNRFIDKYADLGSLLKTSMPNYYYSYQDRVRLKILSKYST